MVKLTVVRFFGILLCLAFALATIRAAGTYTSTFYYQAIKSGG